MKLKEKKKRNHERTFNLYPTEALLALEVII